MMIIVLSIVTVTVLFCWWILYRSRSLRAKFNIFVLGRPDPPIWMFKAALEGRKSRKLVVAFAGGAVLMGGMHPLDFQRTCASLGDCDCLFVSDPWQLWYLKEEQRWRQDLAAICSEYEGRCMFIGNCLGGTGVSGGGGFICIGVIITELLSVF